eukprot:COSAG02_NODE_30973_length_541_cov_1.518100_1_plen_97_part_01
MERMELAFPVTGIAAAAFACGALCGRSVGAPRDAEKEKQLAGEDGAADSAGASGPSEATRDRWEVEQQKLREQLRTDDDPQVAALLDSLAAADGRKW